MGHKRTMRSSHVSATKRIRNSFSKTVAEKNQREGERGWWSIDLDCEVEELEVTGPWSGTEGGSVDSKGEMGHRSARKKGAREECEKLKEVEMEVDGEVPQEESFEIRSPKKKSASGRIRRNARLRAGDSGNQARRRGFVFQHLNKEYVRFFVFILLLGVLTRFELIKRRRSKQF